MGARPYSREAAKPRKPPVRMPESKHAAPIWSDGTGPPRMVRQPSQTTIAAGRLAESAAAIVTCGAYGPRFATTRRPPVV